MYTDGHTLSRHCALPIYGVLTARQRQEVRATIGRFQDAFAAPFINKTQRNCGRILALSEIFPEAAFIRMHRDPFEMVRSRWQIYLSRSEEHTSELQSLMRISYAVFCLKKKNNTHT